MSGTLGYKIGDTVITFDGCRKLTGFAHALHAEVADDSPPQLSIHLDFDASIEGGPGQPQITRSDMGFSMAYSGWRAHFDPERAECRALMNPNVPSKRLEKWVESLTRIVLGKHLQQRHGLSFHGAAMVQAGQGYLFLGPSGSGKTTLVNQWPADATLNDDHVLVIRGERGFELFGTPYSGRENTPCEPAARAPLAAILLLQQDPNTYTVPVPAAKAFSALLPHVIHIPADRRDTEQILDIVGELVDSTPVARLHFSLSEPLWPSVEGAVV